MSTVPKGPPLHPQAKVTKGRSFKGGGQGATPYWLQGEYNQSDILTKQIPRVDFRFHCKFLFWHPDFHLHTNNCLDTDYKRK